jgi:hypothetical protein
MSNYTHRGTCAVPAALQALANAIWRALDPDTGGDLSFDTLRATGAAGAEYVLTSALCTTAFAEQAPYLVATPAALHGVVAQDYAQRWPDLVPPSPEDVAEFCSSARIVVTDRATAFAEHLDELGLVMLPNDNLTSI